MRESCGRIDDGDREIFGFVGTTSEKVARLDFALWGFLGRGGNDCSWTLWSSLKNDAGRGVRR